MSSLFGVNSEEEEDEQLSKQFRFGKVYFSPLIYDFSQLDP